MANLTPVSSFDPVRQLEGTDIAQPSTFNGQAQALLNRTEYLKGQTDFLDAERLRLPSTSSPSDGAGMVGFGAALNYAANTIGWAVKGLALNVQWFGVAGGGVTDDAAALNALIALLPAAGGKLIFPAVAGGYLISDPINLVSNLEFEFHGNAKLVHGAGITTEYIIRGNNCTNLRFRGMEIEGNGLSGLSAIYLTNCTNVTFDTCKITKAGSMALMHDGCTSLTVANSNFSHNYYYGVDERNGTRCKYIASQFVGNGATGVATSTGGRGINIWKSVGPKVIGCDFYTNNEYGLRLYSEVADAAAENVDAIFSACNFKDNAAADIVVYNESGNVRRHIISGMSIVRTTNTTIGGSVVIQGSQVRVSDVHVTKTGTIGTQAAFILFEADNCSLRGCSGKNFTEAVGFGTSTDCEIDGFVGESVSKVGIPLGSGIKVTNSRFTHGGAGVSDVGIQNYSASGKNFFENNLFDGFHTAIYIGDEPVAVFRNTTKNSGFAGLRKTGNAVALLESGGNSWDSTNPWELSALQKTVSVYDRAQTRYTSAPAALTWAVGDRCTNSSPAIGQPKSWVCTVTGTPGTWVSEGNL
jgi:hypothetical protein